MMETRVIRHLRHTSEIRQRLKEKKKCGWHRDNEGKIKLKWERQRKREKGKGGGGWRGSETQRKPWEVRKYDGRSLQSKINKDLNITLRNSPIKEYEDEVFKIIAKGCESKRILKGSSTFEKDRKKKEQKKK